VKQDTEPTTLMDTTSTNDTPSHKKLRERGYPKHIINQHKQIKFHEWDTSTHKSTIKQQITTNPLHKNIRLTTTYNHHHKTIRRLVNKDWTTFQTQLKRKPRTTPKHNNVLQEKPITQKQTSQNQIYTRNGNTNKRTHTKPSLHKQMPHMPQHSNKTPIPKYHNWNNTHNKMQLHI